MSYLFFLKKSNFNLNKFILIFYVDYLNLKYLLKFNKLKNFSKIFYVKKKISILNTLLNDNNKKFNIKFYENFNR